MTEFEETIFIDVPPTMVGGVLADIRFFLSPQVGGPLVTVSPKYQLKYGFLGRFLDGVMVRRQYRVIDL